MNTTTGIWSPVASPNIDPTGTMASVVNTGRMIPIDNEGILYLTLDSTGGINQWYDPRGGAWTAITHWSVPSTVINMRIGALYSKVI